MNKLKKILQKFFIFLFLRNVIYSLKNKKFLGSLEGEIRLFLLKKKFSNKFPVKKRKFLFYPGFPCFGYFLYQIVRVLGLRISHDLEKSFDLAIDWRLDTVRENNIDLERLASSHKILNVRCKDISKVNVEKIFKEVFGYGTFIDPSKFEGCAVRKSNANATHDGEVITCPTDEIVCDKYIFQKLINNQVDKDYVLDLRVNIVGNKIPFIYKTYRSINERFNYIKKGSICLPIEVFSEDEIGKILLFSNKIGMDFGALDVLRDVDDQKIYIIDANSTSYGYYSILNRKEWEEILLRLSEAFYEEFLSE